MSNPVSAAIGTQRQFAIQPKSETRFVKGVFSLEIQLFFRIILQR